MDKRNDEQMLCWTNTMVGKCSGEWNESSEGCSSGERTQCWKNTVVDKFNGG